MKAERKNLDEGSLEKVSGGAYNPENKAPITCGNCGCQAGFTHVTYAFITAVSDEYLCSSCGYYTYYDAINKTGRTTKDRF